MKTLLPFQKQRDNLLVGALAFLLGFYFDLTKIRLGSASLLAESGLFLLLARVLGGLLLAGIVLALLRSGKDLMGLGQISRRQLLLLFLALNALTALYVLTSHTVYVWDNAGYWTVARTLAAQPLGRTQLREVLATTVSMDYNHLLAYPISLVMRVFGGSRAVFLFAISNLYTLPGLWGLSALARDRGRGSLVLAALFPMLTYLGLVGYVDVAACSLAIWAVVIYTSDRPPVSRGLFAGALLVATFLLRRYFFFFAASFGLAALGVKLLPGRKNWKDFLALFGSCALCAIFFTPNFLLEKVLGTDYGDLYGAYVLGLGSDLLLFSRYFGWLLVGGLLAGGVYLLTRRRQWEPIFPLLQLISCFTAFALVQSHGQQHLLLYLPSLALLAALLELDSRRLGAWGGILVSLWCLFPKAQPATIQAIPFPTSLPSFVFFGPTRSDMESLTTLADYVDALSVHGEKTAVVLASSFTLNNETLTNLRPSLNLPPPDVTTVIRYQGTVDKRDPFNWNTLTADYLVVGDPIQTHLGAENQQVMTLFAQDVLSGVGPGSAYSPLPVSFSLGEGCTVRIYERTRDLTGAEYRLISSRLQALYPDYASLYAVPHWVF